MNWEFLISSALAFTLLFVVVLTIGFYVNYKRDQKLRKKKPEVNANEGRYFSRYTPEANTEKVKVPEVEVIESPTLWFKYGHLTPYFIFAALVVGFFSLNFYKFFSDIKLTNEEVESLRFKSYNWSEWSDQSLPAWRDVVKDLQLKNIVILKSADDANWYLTESGRKISIEAEAAWGRWAGASGLKPRTCTFEAWANCRFQGEKSLVLVMPGHWDFAKIDLLLNQGASVLLLGPPAQIFQDNQQVIQWRNLSFEKSFHERLVPMVLRGDQKLTLGWKAGSIVDFHPVSKSYRAVYENPDAWRMPKRSSLRGEFEAALVSGAVGRGRFIWTDAWPEKDITFAPVSDEVLANFQASIFRYLLKHEYSSLATWPGAKPFAFLTSYFIEDNFEVPKKFSETFARENNLKIVWGMTSRFAVENWKQTKAISLRGDLACTGDEMRSFVGENLLTQTRRLALCAKAMTAVTERASKGVFPLEEKFDHNTINAATNLGFDFILTGNEYDYLTPKLLLDKDNRASFLMIGRMTSTDFEKTEGRKISSFDMQGIMKEELGWAGKLRGMYLLNLRSNQISADFSRQIKDVIKQARDQEAWEALATEMAEWWRYRAQVIGGVKPTSTDIEKYNLHRVRVNAEGELKVEVWTEEK